MSLALTRSDTVLFGCNRALRYEWTSSALFGETSDNVVGKTDTELWPNSPEAGRLQSLKEDVVRTGQSVRQLLEGAAGSPFGMCQVHLEPLPDGLGGIGILGVIIPVKPKA